jgi:hypothetical protein
LSVPEYSPDGVLLRTLTYRESEWDDEQRSLMFAYKRYLADLGPHGYSMAEATDVGGDPNDYESGFGWVADAPIIDWVERTKLDRIDAFRAEAGEKANMNGLIFPVRRVTYGDAPGSHN